MDELLAKIARIIAASTDHALAAELVVDTVRASQRDACRDGWRIRKQRQRTVPEQSPMSRVTSVTVPGHSVTGSPLHPPPECSSPDLLSQIQSSDPDPDQSNRGAKKPRARQRHEYSEPFERAWSAYPRRDEKAKAYGEWQRAIEGIADHECLPHDEAEAKLVDRVRFALVWQVPLSWHGDNWRYAPYFERYLKNRKWEDGKPMKAPQRSAPPPPPPPGGFCVGHAGGANVGIQVNAVIQRASCPECRRVEVHLRQSWKEKK